VSKVKEESSHGHEVLDRPRMKCDDHVMTLSDWFCGRHLRSAYIINTPSQTALFNSVYPSISHAVSGAEVQAPPIATCREIHPHLTSLRSADGKQLRDTPNLLCVNIAIGQNLSHELHCRRTSQGLPHSPRKAIP
jgi:hypothetical protein